MSQENKAVLILAELCGEPIASAGPRVLGYKGVDPAVLQKTALQIANGGVLGDSRKLFEYVLKFVKDAVGHSGDAKATAEINDVLFQYLRDNSDCKEGMGLITNKLQEVVRDLAEEDPFGLREP